MNDLAILENQPFSTEQKEYLQGFFAATACRPFAGHLPDGRLTSDPGSGLPNAAAETVFGTPLEDLCEQEVWKRERNGLDVWDTLVEHATANKLPDKKNSFYFRFHGLFYVGPVQESFMLRLRVPGSELTSAQMRGLAEIAREWGGGYAHVTTRANLQIREIAPKNILNVLNKLQELGLTARGSGVDNLRNITSSATAGIDPAELLDTRPMAKALHYYILNNRDLYGLPRKFNISFDGGGSVGTVSETNDIGFVAVTVDKGGEVPPGVYFRVQLAGITGHEQFASDTGHVIRPADAVAVAAAIVRVFAENGDRTNRKKARLKYLIDKWGTDKFMEEVEKKLAFPLVRLPLVACRAAHPPIPHGHIGVFRQKQPQRNYIGVVTPVGTLTARQMGRLADLAQNHGSGTLRLTVWQNVLVPDIPDGFVETVKRHLARMGLSHQASPIMGGLVACTGNAGCKFSATNTKAQAVELARHLEKKVPLDQPINIHLTGCPHSCAQHYIGDIGMVGVKVTHHGEQVEGYHIVLGGRCVGGQTIAREVFHGIPFSEIPQLLEGVLRTYLARRTHSTETFAQFTARHSVKELQELFST
ncbi:MAG: NirA family protein [Chthoniobacterales bacterium]|nr:NirA family protein [Chthoniobacterales bacterium]